jgi:hypothetical protein
VRGWLIPLVAGLLIGGSVTILLLWLKGRRQDRG